MQYWIWRYMPHLAILHPVNKRLIIIEIIAKVFFLKFIFLKLLFLKCIVINLSINNYVIN